MKKWITCAAVLLLACSVQAVSLTNWLVDEWCTNAAVATNPYGNWTYDAGYNGDRVLPYLSLTNFIEAYGMDWMIDTWYNDNVDDAPQLGRNYYSQYADDSTCQLLVSTNGINTSVGWIAPDAGTVEHIFAKWHSRAPGNGNSTNCVNVYIDHTRGTDILDTKYMYTNDYVHFTWSLETIDVTTPFSVLAGDVVYFSFVRRPGAAVPYAEIFGIRWDEGANNAYLVFTPIPEPGMLLALLAGIGLFLRRR